MSWTTAIVIIVCVFWLIAKINAAIPRNNAALVCPHCTVGGKVKTWRTEIKNGISGGKATGAILTGGVSLLATGLSKKKEVTMAECANCTSKWVIG